MVLLCNKIVVNINGVGKWFLIIRDKQSVPHLGIMIEY